MIFLRTNSLIGSTGVISLQGGKQLCAVTTRTADDLLLASHGDSISRDFNLTYENYIFVAAQLIQQDQSQKARVRARGLNGNSWDYSFGFDGYTETLITDALLAVDGWQDPSLTDWLVTFAGTNGMALGGNSVSAELVDFETYINARLSAGWNADNIIVCTMLPRDLFLEISRTEYNNGLVSRAGTFGYRLARFDLDPTMGVAGAFNNPTYYYDGLHPTEAGHEILGQIVKDSIFP